MPVPNKIDPNLAASMKSLYENWGRAPATPAARTLAETLADTNSPDWFRNYWSGKTDADFQAAQAKVGGQFLSPVRTLGTNIQGGYAGGAGGYGGVGGGSSYNATPGAHNYDPAYGGIPNPTGIPPNLYEGAQSIYPGLAGLTGQTGNVIRSQLAGELSPETINAIQNEAASFGVTSGMPLSQFSGYRGLRNLGINVEKLQQQGTENYGAFLQNLAKTTDDPALLSQIATYNAQLAAAPDPAAAAKAAEDAYYRAMEKAQAAGGAKIPSVGGYAGAAFGGGGPGTGTSRGTTAGAYGTPSAVYGPGAAGGAGGLTYGGTTYYGGATPGSAAQSWQNWAAGLPGSSPGAGTGSFYAGSTGGYRPDEFTPAFQPGDFTGINVGDFTPAGGGLPDFGAIYEQAGLPYTDWSNSGINWSIYE